MAQSNDESKMNSNNGSNDGNSSKSLGVTISRDFGRRDLQSEPQMRVPKEQNRPAEAQESPSPKTNRRDFFGELIPRHRQGFAGFSRPHKFKDFPEK